MNKLACSKNKKEREEEIVAIAEYIVTTHATIRKTAEKFRRSKSYVHFVIEEKLPKIKGSLYKEVRKVLDKNKSERHIRGGIATKNKYLKIK